MLPFAFEHTLVRHQRGETDIERRTYLQVFWLSADGESGSFHNLPAQCGSEFPC